MRWIVVSFMWLTILLVPIPPIPMQPITIRLLGALAPNTEEGTTYGAANTDTAAAPERLKNSRRSNIRFKCVQSLDIFRLSSQSVYSFSAISAPFAVHRSFTLSSQSESG